jgi:hypothetical protein
MATGSKDLAKFKRKRATGSKELITKKNFKKNLVKFFENGNRFKGTLNCQGAVLKIWLEPENRTIIIISLPKPVKRSV